MIIRHSKFLENDWHATFNLDIRCFVTAKSEEQLEQLGFRERCITVAIMDPASVLKSMEWGEQL